MAGEDDGVVVDGTPPDVGDVARGVGRALVAEPESVTDEQEATIRHPTAANATLRINRPRNVERALPRMVPPRSDAPMRDDVTGTPSSTGRSDRFR